MNPKSCITIYIHVAVQFQMIVYGEAPIGLQKSLQGATIWALPTPQITLAIGSNGEVAHQVCYTKYHI